MNKCVLHTISTIRQHCRLKSTIVRQTPAEYCLNLVRTNDYENFLCTLLLPKSIRSAAIAIRAFNVEVALVEDQVRDNKIGMMRLKFWEETLSGIYNDVPPRSPIALELHRILSKHKLSKLYFKRLITARWEKLQNSIFLDLESLERYSDSAVSSIYYLLLEAHGTKEVQVDHAVSHLGKAHGIVTLIRSIPHNAHKRISVIPQDLLIKYNIPTETVFRGKCDQSLKDTIFEISSRAKLHLNKARSLQGKVQKETKLIFLPAIPVDIYLENLRQADFNVFHPKLQQRNRLLPLQLYWRKLFRSY
ncbi:NADH dehydrogenase (ubiquinone) complex I, assembly factor 6-like [Orussus abietinus]|uniref:NADH dehydrogenase (ubiquinone) complex I, assembly factor 6 n=1 Tax=Orussus abietinus TaxID=222816 RepID=UPI000626C43E|nr:NADH dehydrogenase (ubiquinone) complex I, assembly factor 6 [Orussus abietinus]XP_023290644.1 NADH dehydrogenase (ubiquinone) complex I, assembly factor 6-like [Orussus abietinus]